LIYIPKSPAEHLFFSMWLKARIEHFNPEGVQTVVVYRNEKVAAVVGFSSPHYNRIEMCIAADDPRWMTKGNVLSVMAPAFVRFKGVTAMVLRKNRRVRKMLEGLGFKNEGTLRGIGPNGENMIVYGLLKSEYMELVKKFRPHAVEGAKEMFGV